jgi:polysaccharide biosynthesis/export protein
MGRFSGDGMHRTDRFRKIAFAFVLGLAPLLAQGQAAQPSAPAASHQPILVLGPGDEVSLHVFGQPSMDTTTYIADDGTLQIPLAGPVHIGGLSPSAAGHAVEAALIKGQFLVNPHVTFTIVKSRSQEVSVLGQVHEPGVFPIASNTTLLELLAQAGGETEEGADTVYILRAGSDGAMHRLSVNLQELSESGSAPEAAEITMQGGDQVYVPRGAEVFVMGEVRQPGKFKLEAGMTVLEVVAHAGGVTNMGSTHRIVIRREGPDGKYHQISANLTDKVQPNDVINVRERIF